ncbi:uncharacterized protein A1O9_07001 [Exophiala aquamarina CBS 119918]|uniref:DNA polymerase epsilon subunit D n=1 Tax=Exophiala aquamarina CBS 119918 TaxID=1182545 RepID=A0A072PAE7_9EURO|nr:uncharacterized protein A1O9_07001 [Exophiala aquamarina CBS 119918]KEF56811.1 hypothetical protein A1O9_07001 [Exophiala aquamarina CBS 119918]
MAPRKSTTSNATDANGDTSMVSNATAASSTSHGHPKPSRQSSGVDDLLLPRTLIQRLARGVLPPNTSLQRDAVLALSKSATVFISYLAHHANEQANTKTVFPQDVLKALNEVELANVMDLGALGKDGRTGGRLERELEVYESALTQKRKNARDRKSNKMRESTGTGVEGGDEADENERGEPSNKRARRMEEDDDEDADEENRMLDLQLNGAQDAEEALPGNATKGTRRKKPATDEKGKGKIVDTESDPELDPEGEKEDDEDDEGNNEEDDDDDDDGDGDDDDDDDDDEQDDDENNEETGDQLEERNGSRSRYGHRGLQPNGRIEIDGSDEESD